MKIKFITIFAVSLCAIVLKAHAVESKGDIACGAWVNTQKNPKESPFTNIQQTSWLMGYISGIALVSGADVLRGEDPTSIYLYITNYCQSKPLEKVSDAGIDLFYALVKKKGLKYP